MNRRSHSILPAGFIAAMLLVLPVSIGSEGAPADKLPKPGTTVVDQTKRELVLSAQVQFPEDKPCINEFGQRVQAFAGCATAAGGDAKMAGYFVFLVDVPTKEVFDGLMELGCRPRVHYSIQEGRKRSGLTPETTMDDYLQGDPVAGSQPLVTTVICESGVRIA